MTASARTISMPTPDAEIIDPKTGRLTPVGYDLLQSIVAALRALSVTTSGQS